MEIRINSKLFIRKKEFCERSRISIYSLLKGMLSLIFKDLAVLIARNLKPSRQYARLLPNVEHCWNVCHS